MPPCPPTGLSRQRQGEASPVNAWLGMVTRLSLENRGRDRMKGEGGEEAGAKLLHVPATAVRPTAAGMSAPSFLPSLV